MKTTVLVKLDVRDPNLSKLREVVRGARDGKIVAFPTETVYGIGGPMSVPKISQTLAEIKKRTLDKPFSYHIGDWGMVDLLGVKRTPAFRFLSRSFWPGPVTLVAETNRGDKIGLRYPRARLALALINASGEPFVATSANISGQPSPRSAEEVMKQLSGQIDYLIDGGPCDQGEDSTVVDASVGKPEILRRGALVTEVEKALEKIYRGKFPRKKILIVCTGNSCRSPMAAGWLASELLRKGYGDQIEVASCGIGARTGYPATPEAILAMKNREIDIQEHRSRSCTRDDMLDADMIFAMSEEHYQFITGMVPQAKERIKVLNIPDPIGLGMMVYEKVIEAIEKKLRENWNEIIN
ncbi:MAG: threonylcarbamoyl-AMP synthase [Candidatus Omnitrophica bacterium]|nr:threonylcarbamoyl-AMP synthase [Candidatus Omnitrophota bacterium]